MRSGKLLLFPIILLFSLSSSGQVTPDLEQGMKPYGSYQGGNLDHISMSNGNLFFHADLMTYSQRGEFAYPIVLQYNGENLSLFHQTCPSTVKPGQCPVYEAFGPPWVMNRVSKGNSVTIGVDAPPKVIPSGGPGLGINTTLAMNGNPIYVQLYSVLTSDGSLHPLVNANAGQMTLDGSGYSTASGNLTDRHGNKYGNVAEDANGNQINFTNGTDTLGRQIPASPVSPGPITNVSTPPASTASLSACPSLGYTNQPVTYAYIWSLPTVNSGSLVLTLCYTSLYVNTSSGDTEFFHGVHESFLMLQSVVFPDNTYWAFQYDAGDPNNSSLIALADLLKITFPTGGSVSYTWAACPCSGSNMGRSVMTRSVDANDGNGPRTWHYSYSNLSTVNNNPTMYTTVTDPLGNDTVHTMTGLGGFLSFYETQVQYFQGSQTSGTLLKTVTTDYQYTANAYDSGYVTGTGSLGASESVTNVFPIRVTTTLPNGLVTKTETDYDTALSYHGPLDGIQYNETSCVDVGAPQPVCNASQTYTIGPTNYNGTIGTVIAKREYDWGQGAPGPLVRQTVNNYLWQSNSSYLAYNFLDLVSASTVYDGSGNQVARTTYGYDEYSLNSSGVTTQFNSNPVNGTVRGNQTSAHHWLNGSVTSTANCAVSVSNGYLVSYTQYNNTGTVYKSTDACGTSPGDPNHTTTHTYSPSYAGAYPTQTCKPAVNGVTQCVSGAYDFDTGLLTSFTDANNQASSYSYDNRWRMTQALFPPDSGGIHPETDFFYPSATTVERCKKQNDNSGTACGTGWVVDYAYFDGLGRTRQTRLVDPVPGDDYVDTTYDAVGRVSTVSNPHRSGSSSTDGITTSHYDALGRVTGVTKQDGSNSSVLYAGNCVTATDEAGKSRKSCSDGLGRLTGVWEDPAGVNYETDYQYDTLNNLLRVDQKGSAPGDSTQWRTRRFTYDSLSHLLSAQNPESGQISYSYDADGNVLTKTDARGIVATSTYDFLNRLTETSYSDGHASEIFYYDETSSWGSTLTNTVGRLTTMYHGNTGEVLSYDPMGRITDQWSCGPHNCGSGSYHVQAQYDLTGNLTQLGYPSTRVVSFNYNPADRLNQVQFTQWNWAPVDGGAYTYWSTADSGFFPNGVPQNWILGSGLTESTVLNPRLQLQEEIVSMPGLGTFADHVYNFGVQNNGNVLSVTDKLSSAYSQSFSYDSLNRLASATETRWGMNYVYDAWGNYLQQNLTLGSGYQHQYLASGNNQLIGYSYDANGNMLYDGFHHYDYNAENQILDVDSYTDSYTYDALGNRERKDTSGQPSTEYVYFKGEVIAEKNTSTEDWSEYIYANGKRIAKAANFEDRILIQGTNCSNCGSQYTGFTINGTSWLPYVVRAGDRLMLRQKTNSGRGGVVLYFSDGSSTRNVATDSDGQLLNSDGMTGYFHYRTADLSAYAGKTLTSIAVISETTSGAGAWLLKFADFVLISTDGTVQPIYTNETTASLTQFGTSGVTGVSGGVDHVSNSSDPTNTTWYYHGDQIGSSRLMSANEGWPVWQGTFLPYGEEYNQQITTNHYKFTGKERDSETGLDYFGARYYGNTLGRFTSSDPLRTSARPVAPQTWNRYAYVHNNPIAFADYEGLKDYYVFRPAATSTSQSFNNAKSAVEKNPDNHVIILNGPDATVKAWETARTTLGATIIFSGHTLHDTNSDGTIGKTNGITLNLGTSAGDKGFQTYTITPGANAGDPPTLTEENSLVMPPHQTQADTVAIFGCQSIDLAGQYGGANFVGMESGTDKLSNTETLDDTAAAFLAAEGSGKNGIQAANAAFQQNARQTPDVNDKDGDKVIKQEKKPN